MSLAGRTFDVSFIVRLCLTVTFTQLVISAGDGASINNRPIIGVLTQELSRHLKTHYSKSYDSYIAASYVKFIEGAGARVVPILIGKSYSYYEDITSKINGVLWPGGSTLFNKKDGYADAGKKIFKIASKINKRGDYFPIFGICLGFELLIYTAANGVNYRTACNSTNQPLALKFTSDVHDSRMFRNASTDVLNILTKKNVTINFHHYCITKNDLTKARLTNRFRVLSLNRDLHGVQFISALEHVSYPFYGLQFHPEKNIYEWITERKIPHGIHAIRASQYFAEFFVNESRKSKHSFSSEDEESRNLIYNYPVTYTGRKKSPFEQCYMFKNATTI